MSLTALVRIVDEESMVREVVAGYPRRDGLRGPGLGDGTAALDWDQPDLVVLDLILSSADGLKGSRARHGRLTERKFCDGAR